MADELRVPVWRNRNNRTVLELQEDSVAIPGSPTRIDIVLGTLTITRNPPGTNGITFAAGRVTIDWGKLTSSELTSLDALTEDDLLNGAVIVYDGTDTEGIVFGREGSRDRLLFLIKDD